MHLSNKQTDPTIAFVEKASKLGRQWAMCNVKPLSKKFRSFDEYWPKCFWQNISQYAAQLNAVPPISAKTLASPSIP